MLVSVVGPFDDQIMGLNPAEFLERTLQPPSQDSVYRAYVRLKEAGMFYFSLFSCIFSLCRPAASYSVVASVDGTCLCRVFRCCD